MWEDDVSGRGQTAQAGIFTENWGIHDLKATQASEEDPSLSLDSRSSWYGSMSSALRRDMEVATLYLKPRAGDPPKRATKSINVGKYLNHGVGMRSGTVNGLGRKGVGEGVSLRVRARMRVGLRRKCELKLKHIQKDSGKVNSLACEFLGYPSSPCHSTNSIDQ